MIKVLGWIARRVCNSTPKSGKRLLPWKFLLLGGRTSVLHHQTEASASDRISHAGLIVWLLLSTYGSAGILDDGHRWLGNRALAHHQWHAALEAYTAIPHPDAVTRYTLATLHYRLGHYRQAMALYAKIHDPALAYRRLHNLGNCAMQVRDYTRAVALYRAALALHPSKRTQYNLTLALQALKQKKKIGAACTTNILPRRRSAKEGNANLDDNTTSNEGKWKEINQTVVRADNLSRPHAHGQSDTAHTVTFAPRETRIELTRAPEPLTEREQVKWDRTLRNRPVKTLLIPLGSDK